MRYGLECQGDPFFNDRIGFPVQSSVLDEQVLLNRVVCRYNIPEPVSCRFLTRGDSDIYRVTAGDARYYLKVYRPPVNLECVEGEAQFVHDLAERGFPAVRPVRLDDGCFATQVKASEGNRPMLLFEEAPSGKIQIDNLDTIVEFGTIIAKLHDVADSLEDTYILNESYIGAADNPMLQYLADFITDTDFSYIEGLNARVMGRLSALPQTTPDFGLCHADLVISNVRVDTNGVIILFDFGNAAYTWRSFELAIIKWSLGHRTDDPEEYWKAFLSGYSQIRKLPAGIPAHLNYFHILRQINFLAGNAASLPLRLGTEVFEGDFMSKGVQYLRNLEAELM